MLKTLLSPFASLKLTVTLIVLSMIMIYAGTWAQIDKGIEAVQKEYFHSWFKIVDFDIFLPRSSPSGDSTSASLGRGALDFLGRIRFPILGGYALGVLMLANLLAAHAFRFKFAWKRTGIIMIHAALILLLVGEGIRSAQSVESQMHITEGTYADYSIDHREMEMVVIEPGGEKDSVTAIRQSLIEEGKIIHDARIPFEIKINHYYPNALVRAASMVPDAPKATAGNGLEHAAQPTPIFSGTGADAGKVDQPAAYITLTRDNQVLGTYLVSAVYSGTQDVKVGDKTYGIALRFRRYYKPFQLHLIDFKFDRYIGTDVPKNYSSQVRLVDPERNEDREVLIWMNHPLRYRGETYFQSSFDPRTEQTTVLQVMKNPGWTMPYIACAIGALGLLFHFGLMLIGFLKKQAARQAALVSAARVSPPARGKSKKEAYVLAPEPRFFKAAFIFPAVMLALCLFHLLSYTSPRKPKSEFDINAFGDLPVTFEGRTQPFDALARNSLKIIAGREGRPIRRDNKIIESTIGPKKSDGTEWLLDTMTGKGDDHKVFLIHYDELLGFLNLPQGQKWYSFNQIIAKGQEFMQQDQAARAQQRSNPKQLSAFQASLIDLSNKLMRYMLISREMGKLHIIPPTTGDQWVKMADGYTPDAAGRRHPLSERFLQILQAYEQNRPAEFDAAVAAYAADVDTRLPETMSKVRFEASFNRFDPQVQSIVLYLIAFLLTALSWIGWQRPLARAGYWILLLAILVHTGALIGRIYISGRPPVTNLESSAIFIAWGAALLAAGVERFSGKGLGTVIASVAGFTGLLIYSRLALEGDTMKVLQAVLDTNFWLATHVVCMVLGYSTTFLAGLFAIAYVIMGVFTRQLNPDNSKELHRIIYGVTCFAMFFSFVGTVLGGIWADQSWGRFWGWDPKENGAVLIVLVNALLLHARWAGLARDRGVAALALFGNIVTAWSWFGTNMLGVGLHSYGFMESALFWLLLFCLSQLFLIGIVNLPMRWWRSTTLQSQLAAEESIRLGKIVPAAV